MDDAIVSYLRGRGVKWEELLMGHPFIRYQMASTILLAQKGDYEGYLEAVDDVYDTSRIVKIYDLIPDLRYTEVAIRKLLDLTRMHRNVLTFYSQNVKLQGATRDPEDLIVTLSKVLGIGIDVVRKFF
jgi:hypothetical protein